VLVGPPNGLSRTARRQAQTRAELITAAREIIAERAVAAPRVSDVTKRADVAFGTFYYQFKTKDDIVEAVVAAAISLPIEKMDHDIGVGTPGIDRAPGYCRTDGLTSQRHSMI
jgi:AcrR family transcriptional regulator